MFSLIILFFIRLIIRFFIIKKIIVENVLLLSIYLDIDDFEKCNPGYVGRFCRARYVYPLYGEEFEAQCNCSERMFDVATGCKPVDRGMAHFFL